MSTKVQAFVDKLSIMSEVYKKTILKVTALAAAIIAMLNEADSMWGR
ncbi:MAG: hypothetical protein IJ899_05240 [Blautia sp.]|nr:hypothetical protein [Blautia sp.]